MKILINHYALSVHGFCIDYSTAKEKFNYFADPQATCELFKELRIIDDWEADKNGEPIILGTREHDFEEEETGRIIFTERPVFIHWCDFVKAFALLPRQLEIVAEHHNATNTFKKIETKIISLLQPLSA